MKWHYSVNEVRKLFPRVSYRQMQYWDDSNFIKPSGRKGRNRKYSSQDVILIALAHELHYTAGMSIQKQRAIIPKLEKILNSSFNPEQRLDVMVNDQDVVITPSTDWAVYDAEKRNTIYFTLLSLSDIMKNRSASGNI